MLDTVLNLLAQGLLTQLPASVITAGITAVGAGVIHRRRKRGDCVHRAQRPEPGGNTENSPCSSD
ncbi:hypothetical protein Spla01_00972 [Streptomyces platensis]|uniref:Uncharacterized protein n=1 Tax=Streptomyces platensis TaxID=58346 RepID=A0ABX3XQS0_STRPT|nr:hypothetical protein BG653_05395 [Streptomyces platensis]